MDSFAVSILQDSARFPAILDTNLLLLYIVGKHNVNAIGNYKRTQKYTQNDYVSLWNLLSRFNRIATTPHVLTQLTDLAEPYSRANRNQPFLLLRDVISKFNEQFLPSCDIAKKECFIKFGLADASLVELSRLNYVIITDDLPLYHYLSTQKLRALNFNHFRQLR